MGTSRYPQRRTQREVETGKSPAKQEREKSEQIPKPENARGDVGSTRPREK